MNTRDRFARLIAATGPISLAQFMAESNARYYDSRDPLGSAGDFITAPEISQMFGELIGLWLVDIWDRAGRPANVHYVEPGPGRGTLARDALGAAARFGLTPHVHFVEASSALAAIQRDLFPGATWHGDMSSVPDGAPLLIVANEFLDALPIRQLVCTVSGWRERMVGLAPDGPDADGPDADRPDADRLVPIAGDRPMDAAVPAQFIDAAPGTILEACPAAAAVVGEIARRLATQGGAALIIDYGRTAMASGSSLQALRAHQHVDPFAHPGEADLTAHVDFSVLPEIAQNHGARWLGTVEQGAFLSALGLPARARALCKAAPDKAQAINAATHRLTAPEAMGTLFKVMGLSAPNWPEGAGF